MIASENVGYGQMLDSIAAEITAGKMVTGSFSEDQIRALVGSALLSFLQREEVKENKVKARIRAMGLTFQGSDETDSSLRIIGTLDVSSPITAFIHIGAAINNNLDDPGALVSPEQSRSFKIEAGPLEMRAIKKKGYDRDLEEKFNGTLNDVNGAIFGGVLGPELADRKVCATGLDLRVSGGKKQIDYSITGQPL